VRLWHILQSRLRSIFFRHRRESDLKEELQLHLDQEIERLRASGLSLDDARSRARRVFGGVEQLKEECRDARRIITWDAVARETRQSLRRLVRDWRFSGAVVLILGLAIGANTAVFSLVNAVLFRKQATADPAHLVNIYQNDRSGKPMVVTSYDVYKEIAAYSDVFAGAMAASVPSPLRYLHDGALRNAAVEFATATYLDVVGLRPSVGRWFDETEERTGAPLVGVLGYQTWTRVFHADPSIVGRAIRVEGAPVTIVGVAPANHRGTLDLGLATDLWLPMTAFPVISQEPAPRASPTIYLPLLVKARLRPGVTVAQARAAMDVLGRRLEAEHPEDFRRSGEFALGSGMTVMASTDVRIHPQADVPFMVLAALTLGIVGLVLAIAASNVATLLLVRSTARAKEVCVRLALGATRRQVVWHQLSESLMLALAGGVVGCLLAWWGAAALQRIDLPITVDVTLDYRVLAFAILLSLFTGISFGLTPAIKATRVDLVQTLRAEGRQSVGHRRLTLQNALVVVQVAISVLLLGGTSIFLQMLHATRAHRVEFAVSGVAMLETDLRFASHPEAAVRTMYDNLLPRVRAIPGVESAALLRGLPMEANGTTIVVDRVAADDGAGVEATIVDAGPGFFDTLRIPLVYGRVFDVRDRADTPRVAVITESMARRYFDTVNAVGRRFRLSNDLSSWTEVIGVVRDRALATSTMTSSIPLRRCSSARTRSLEHHQRRLSRGRRVTLPRCCQRCSVNCVPSTSRCRS
jgi:predicted permease